MSQSIQSYVSSDTKMSTLDIIRAEESLPGSTSHLVAPEQTNDPQIELLKCICKTHDESSNVKISPAHVEEILRAKEIELREEYDRILEREKKLIQERYNLILLNEQTRASYMLREAHRERQEKIHALQSQLQCKNLAALMYVMCTERKRSRFEKLQIIEDYTNYIDVLHDILTKGQELILHLSRGYKTAARVDHEWREKMKKVVGERSSKTKNVTLAGSRITSQPKKKQIQNKFLSFIYHFAGGDPDTNQFLLDLPQLLKTDAPVDINPNEKPCDCDDDIDELQEEMLRTERKEWWEDLDAEDSPFVMYGDMGEFPPDRRRETLKSLKAKKIKAQKTAPKEWEEMSFKEMFLKSKCVHLDKIKSLYQDKLPIPVKWECLHSPANGDLKGNSKMSIPISHRGVSVDLRGAMGSILKMIAAGPTTAPVPAKTALLGARDSIEIASMMKVRMSIKPDMPERQYHEEKEVLSIGRRRTSVFTDNGEEEESTVQLQKSKIRSKNSAIHENNGFMSDEFPVLSKSIIRSKNSAVHENNGFMSDEFPVLSKSKIRSKISAVHENNDCMSDELSVLGSVHTDSLQMLHSHQPEPDHMINYERVCPMEKCQRLQVDSFMRSLPPYMRANPFTHFEQTFEEYETCTPEQLEMLQQRIENRKNKELKKDPDSGSGLASPLSEWFSTGVAVQTSEILPPCTCYDEALKSPEPRDRVLDLAGLELVKRAMDAIHKEYLFSDKIEFDRFKLVGEDSKQHKQEQTKNNTEFRETRYQEISEVLNKHPSLLDIFQANAK